MKDRDVEIILLDTLERLGVTVRKEMMEDSSGGYCRLGKNPVIVYPPGLSLAKRIELFLSALRKLDTSGIFIPPVIRDKIESPQDPDI